MSSQSSTSQVRQSLASGLKNALEVYGHITPPNEHNDSDCTRFIGRCLVELNEEQQQHKERLQIIERHTRGSPYDGPTFSSQNDKIDGIWEEVGEIKSKLENIEDKVQENEDTLKSIEEKIESMEENVESIEENVESMEAKNEERFNSFECTLQEIRDRFKSMEEKNEERFNTLESKFDKFMFDQDVWASRQRNSLASRLYQPVQPVGISYIDADGKPVLKVPTQPVKSVGYYWKMHNRENHLKLIDAHNFYQLDFRHWAISDDEASDSSYETQDLDLPLTTLEQAVSMYPDRAVMALFNALGLVYSRFQEQVERQQLRLPVLQKRSPKDTSSVLEHRVKRPSEGSTTEILTELLGSPTASGS